MRLPARLDLPRLWGSAAGATTHTTTTVVDPTALGPFLKSSNSGVNYCPSISFTDRRAVLHLAAHVVTPSQRVGASFVKSDAARRGPPYLSSISLGLHCTKQGTTCWHRAGARLAQTVAFATWQL